MAIENEKIGYGGNGNGNESGDGNRILIEAEKEDGTDDQTKSSASGDISPNTLDRGIPHVGKGMTPGAQH